jgi:uncharacterized protein YndB with AHSA1/START domain
MNKIEQSLIIEAPPQAIWHILGDLTQAPAYIPGIVQARVEGSQRICLDADGNEIREEISDYSAEGLSYRFEHVQSPLPVNGSRGRFTVVPQGEVAEVRMEWQVEFADPVLAQQVVPMLEGAAQMTLANLRQQVLASTVTA